MNIVYWVHNEDCSDYLKDGYIGVTSNLESRFDYHSKRNKKIPKDKPLSITVLFEGSREDCFNKEKEFRPEAGIGWNSAVGGSHGWKEAFIHSEETKQKLKNAWTEERKEEHRKRLPEHNKKLIGQKRPKQSKAISGKNNGMFGKNHSEDSKEKMSKSRKGKPAHNKIEYYCIHCHERVSPTVARKYHGPGKKACR